MYSPTNRIYIVLGLSALAATLKIDFLQPTQALNGYPFNGFTPKPTDAPFMELWKRGSSSSICGYLQGDPANPLSCGGACAYLPAYGWWGCCAEDSNGKPTACPVATRCVDYTFIDSCQADAECASDTLLIGCTDAELPFCATLALYAGTETLGKLFCDTTKYIAEFMLTAGGQPSSGLPLDIETTSTDDSFESTSTDDSFSGKSKATTRESSTDSGAAVTVVPTSSKTGGLGGRTAVSSATSTGAAAVKTGATVMRAVGGVAGMIMMFA